MEPSRPKNKHKQKVEPGKTENGAFDYFDDNKFYEQNITDIFLKNESK